MHNFLKVIRNKYFITFMAFLVWMLFFDNYNIFKRVEYNNELNDLLKQKEFYLTDIANDKEALHELMTNEETLEKFAREKYLMKRDNEDVYVVIRQDSDSTADPHQ